MNQLNAIDGERGIPDVNTVTISRWKRGAVLLVMVAALVAGAAVAYLKFGQNIAPVEQADTQRTMTTASTVKPRTFVSIPEPEPIQLAALPVQPIVPVALPAPKPVRPIKSIKTAPTLDKSASRSTVLDNSTATNTAAQVSAQPASANATNGGFFGNAGNGAQAAPDSGNLASSLRPTKLSATSANLLANRNLLIAAGAFIDCALSTRLDSTVPGMTSCVVTRDVFGDDGKLVLIERGSLVTGEYRSNLKQGMSRIFVLWNRVKTPEGVVINLDSPATDSLGASGIAGHVDNHFWKRFGGAFLLSLVDDVARAATTSSNNNNENTQIVLGSASNASSDLAAEILRNTINIPPTLYANQGSRVGIFVARDLDFSNVYDAVPQ